MPLIFTGCAFEMSNSMASQRLSLKTDLSLLNQNQSVTKVVEVVKSSDGTETKKISEHKQSGTYIEVVNLKGK